MYSNLISKYIRLKNKFIYQSVPCTGGQCHYQKVFDIVESHSEEHKTPLCMYFVSWTTGVLKKCIVYSHCSYLPIRATYMNLLLKKSCSFTTGHREKQSQTNEPISSLLSYCCNVLQIIVVEKKINTDNIVIFLPNTNVH